MDKSMFWVAKVAEPLPSEKEAQEWINGHVISDEDRLESVHLEGKGYSIDYEVDTLYEVPKGLGAAFEYIFENMSSEEVEVKDKVDDNFNTGLCRFLINGGSKPRKGIRLAVFSSAADKNLLFGEETDKLPVEIPSDRSGSEETFMDRYRTTLAELVLKKNAEGEKTINEEDSKALRDFIEGYRGSELGKGAFMKRITQIFIEHRSPILVQQALQTALNEENSSSKSLANFNAEDTRELTERIELYVQGICALTTKPEVFSEILAEAFAINFGITSEENKEILRKHFKSAVEKEKTATREEPKRVSEAGQEEKATNGGFKSRFLSFFFIKQGNSNQGNSN